jgi:error-prone DNA polymerase
VKGLRAEAIHALLEARERGGAFRSFEDLRRRARLHTADLERLVKSGACDSIGAGHTRAELLWELYLCEAAATRATGTDDLFAPPPPTVPRAAPYDRATMLRHEIEALGFLVSAHPLESYQRAMRGHGIIAGRDIDHYVGRRVKLLGWHVTSKLIHDKHERLMEFVGFEDTTALYDATFFPNVYERVCHLLAGNRPFLITGKVEQEYGVSSVVVENVERLN